MKVETKTHELGLNRVAKYLDLCARVIVRQDRARIPASARLRKRAQLAKPNAVTIAYPFNAQAAIAEDADQRDQGGGKAKFCADAIAWHCA
jgi:hypothetical protein